jgi:outer membrane protein assembly factor BamB
MKKPWKHVCWMAGIGFTALTVPGIDSTNVHWPSFRGAQARGVAEGERTPEHWSVSRNESIRWKTAIPGLGHSSPIVWGNRLFLTTAEKEGDEAKLKVGLYGDIQPIDENAVHRWVVYCLDKNSGKILWSQTSHEGVPQMKRHPKSSHASSTPATDGEHVVCFFGAEGLFCFGIDGGLRWKKSLGSLDSGYFAAPSAQWGFASSPLIHNQRVIVQCDVQTNSFLAAFDLRDGKEIWRSPRNDVPTWSTPTIDSRADRTQIIVNGFKHAGGYDFETGKELWILRGGGDIPVPTPIIAHDLIFLTSAHGRMAPIYAIRPNATGDISLAQGSTNNAHIVWSVPRRGNYMQTPIVYGDYLYCCNDAGVLTCYRSTTGDVLYSERLGAGGTGFTASAVAGDGKLYFTSEQGDVYVIKAGPKFELLSKNDLDEVCMATPAVSQGSLFFRTRHHLIAVAKP